MSTIVDCPYCRGHHTINLNIKDVRKSAITIDRPHNHKLNCDCGHSFAAIERRT